MSSSKLVTFCVIATFISGCSSLGGGEPFQIYEPKTDCVSCKKQEKWGFVKKLIYRHNQIAYFASYEPRASSPTQLERMGLCYGTAIDTIKSGATHFRILDKEKWGDWYAKPTPATISSPDIFGRLTINMGGAERTNRDQSEMWWTNHYYEIASPKCEGQKEICSTKHNFNLQDCPYEGEELRKETEEKKGSLACVMKRNPRLLFHEVYSSEAGCYRFLEVDYWIPANDVIRKFEWLFGSEHIPTNTSRQSGSTVSSDRKEEVLREQAERDRLRKPDGVECKTSSECAGTLICAKVNPSIMRCMSSDAALKINP